MDDTLSWLIPLLICPVCERALLRQEVSSEGEQGLLIHGDGVCAESYPIIDGIPRLLVGEHRRRLVRLRRSWFEGDAERRELAGRWSASARESDVVVAGFDDEWSSFRRVGTAELSDVFATYFDLVGADEFAPTRRVLDAGCGAGRWAYEVARRGPRVVAVDLGLSVELAQMNTLSTGRVACVQADLRHLPVAAGSFDWAYSLGVLHHLDNPRLAVRRMVTAVRPGSRVLVYLYYSLENRGRAYRALYQLADAARRFVSKLPRPLIHVVASVIAVTVYLPLARSAAVLERTPLANLALSMPLSLYRHRSLEVMLNDSLDRFGTGVERRFSMAEITELLDSAGLSAIKIAPSAPYWHATGTRIA